MYLAIAWNYLLQMAANTTIVYVKSIPLSMDIFIDRNLINKIVYIIAAICLTVLLFYFFARIFVKIYKKIESLKNTILKPIVFRGNTVISDESLVKGMTLIVRIMRLLLSFLALYTFFNFIIYILNIRISDNVFVLIKGILLALLTVVVTAAMLKSVQVFHRYLRNNLKIWTGSIIKPLSFKGLELVSAERISEVIVKSTFLLQFLLIVLILYFLIPVLFSFFEYTRSWSVILFGYITRPLKIVFTSFINYLPNLFFIGVILILNRYVIKILKMIFNEVERGKIRLPGFYSEWAVPTFKISRFMVIVFTCIVVFPYLPGSNSGAFKGISIFIGVLFSLGSTSVIANIVAGTVLTYMIAFKIGDRVKIGDTIGDVTEKTLLVTRVKTPKNVVVTIPNSTVMSSHIINYSSSARKEGLILHTTITLGYDAPWRRVHEALKEAAKKTGDIDSDREPFVLQTALGDFAVSYELNAYTEKPEKMAAIYSELHQNIQDSCNEAGIEILSPHFSAIRDGNRTTIPEEYLGNDYVPPFFRLFTEKK